MTYLTSEEAQCLGKHKYPVFHLAQMVAGKKLEAKLMAYKCPHCGYFHVGNAPEKKREVRRAKMSNGGKGSTQRPRSIPDEEWANRWDAIFQKEPKDAESVQVEETQNPTGEARNPADQT